MFTIQVVKMPIVDAPRKKDPIFEKRLRAPHKKQPLVKMYDEVILLATSPAVSDKFFLGLPDPRYRVGPFFRGCQTPRLRVARFTSPVFPDPVFFRVVTSHSPALQNTSLPSFPSVATRRSPHGYQSSDTA